jgi:hypothetical protein
MKGISVDKSRTRNPVTTGTGGRKSIKIACFLEQPPPITSSKWDAVMRELKIPFELSVVSRI